MAAQHILQTYKLQHSPAVIARWTSLMLLCLNGSKSLQQVRHLVESQKPEELKLFCKSGVVCKFTLWKLLLHNEKHLPFQFCFAVSSYLGLLLQHSEGRMDGGMDGWTEGWMDGRRDGWRDGSIYRIGLQGWTG